MNTTGFSERKDETGKQFGHLTVISFAYRKGSLAYWNCLCDCGKTGIYSGNELRFVRTSCGHLRSKHGLLRNGKVPSEYWVWRAMKRRMLDPNFDKFKDYGGRGLTMDPRWISSFSDFMADMGPRPVAGYSIERKNNDRGYWPDNCKWDTAKNQQNNLRSNRRFTWNGMTKTVAQWSEFTGLRYSTLYTRLCRDGWRVDDALTKPFKWKRPKFRYDAVSDYEI